MDGAPIGGPAPMAGPIGLYFFMGQVLMPRIE